MAHDPQFTATITTALGARARLKLDAEGWPMVPGKYGRIEWRGPEPDGTARVFAYTDRPKMIAKLRAVPRAHPAQIGDQEAVFSVAATDVTAIKAFAGLLKTRTRASRPDRAGAFDVVNAARRATLQNAENRQKSAPMTKSYVSVSGGQPEPAGEAESAVA
jgi:hypothetical protein